MRPPVRFRSAPPVISQVALVNSKNLRGDWSDIDLALDTGAPIDYLLLGELKEVLGETNIFCRFDILDLQALSDSEFKSVIQKEKILW